ncbi:hypothetical protein [Haloplanus salinus]|nr:hypothetical protein [Haloplanus salinus]
MTQKAPPSEVEDELVAELDADSGADGGRPGRTGEVERDVS